jgi:methionyl-tRNA synthetase
MLMKAASSPREYLLIPSHPTPNGPLHLGHMAGPYLRLDVLRRALLRRGDRPVAMFPIDVYDSYVLLRALKDRTSEREVVDRFSNEIVNDLKTMDIGVDHVVNPLSVEWYDVYRTSVMEVVERLQALSLIAPFRETFLHNPVTDRFMTGCWILGRCPVCKKDSGSYSCEACGAHYRPQELLDAKPRHQEEKLDAVEVTTLEFRLPDPVPLTDWVNRKLPPAFRDIVLGQIKRAGPGIRVTVPGTWGLSYEVEGEKIAQVIFPGFASLGLLLTCGKRYQEIHENGNPFAIDSKVTTVCSFGIDNTVTRVLSCVGGALGLGDVRSPDHLLLNHFYRLEGKKFSTSRKHAIWASEIATLPPRTSDVVRFYLLKTAPEEGETDFIRSDFAAQSNEFVARWNPSVKAALKSITQAVPAPLSESRARALKDALLAQDDCLEPDRFESRSLPAQIWQWMQSPPADAEDSYWWLKGLALLAWPVLPKSSSALWNRLGGAGDPTCSGYAVRTPLLQGLTVEDWQFHPVDELRLGTSIGK